jgi:iron(III) transport system substrate-binding protein
MHSLVSRLGTSPARRRIAASIAAALALSTVAACGGESSSGEEPAPNKIVEGQAPDYYPADYATQVIDASKDEGGELTIYSNTAEENWAPIFRDFQKKYPWVEKLSANDLDSDEVFQKVLSEQSTGSSPVDMMVSNASTAWATFAERPDTLLDYESPELTELPDFALLLPNVYAMSADPMTIAYNTALMEKAPTGIKSLADIAEADPDTYDGKITVRDPEISFGFTVTRAFTEANPDGWSDLERLPP